MSRPSATPGHREAALLARGLKVRARTRLLRVLDLLLKEFLLRVKRHHLSLYLRTTRRFLDDHKNDNSNSTSSSSSKNIYIRLAQMNQLHFDSISTQLTV